LQIFNTVFKGNADLKALSQQAADLSALQKQCQEIIPTALSNQVQVGAIENKSLTLYASNGAVAAKIKLLLPSLLSQLQKQGLAITRIRVTVKVQSHAPPAKKPVRHLSQQAAENIYTLAQKLQGSPLGEALERLAQRAKK
jgi:hypothetical protein